MMIDMNQRIWPGDTRLHHGDGHSPGEVDFGDLRGECAAALAHTVIAPLTHLGRILASGADAETFLQGQLSNDLRLLTPELGQLSSYNSPKGRVLAVLALLRAGDCVELETSQELVAPLLKRLRMFVLRAKIQLEDCSQTIGVIGLAGPQAAQLLQQAGLPVPAQQPWSVRTQDQVRIVSRPGTSPRFSLHAPADIATGLWQRLSALAQPVGTAAWRLLDVLAGVPSVVTATQDHFVAQMLNLDRCNAISFTKGCYTGQEVVARLHYLGQLKRRMFLLYTQDAEPRPGTHIYVAGGDGQAVGEVVAAAPHPERHCALLAVLQLSAAASADLRLDTPAGAPLSVPRELVDAVAA
jgi:folate-binding protein YgfZ